MVINYEGEDKEFWVKVYDTARAGADPLTAKNIADKYTENRVNKRIQELTNSHNALGMSVVEHGGEILTRDNDGEYFFDAILIGVDEHEDGKRISEDTLKAWADYINENGLVADVDHQQIKKYIDKGYTPDKIKTMMKSKLGIAKTVKAFFEEGQLRIRAWIDKRYKNIVNKVKGLSLESFVQYDDDDPDLVVGGDIFGFTFNVDTDPAYAGAKIVG